MSDDIFLVAMPSFALLLDRNERFRSVTIDPDDDCNIWLGTNGVVNEQAEPVVRFPSYVGLSGEML